MPAPKLAATRDARGRFVPGGPPGPGRPRRSVTDIPGAELAVLARPVTGLQLHELVAEIQIATAELRRVAASDAEAAELAKLHVANRTLAAQVLGLRLAAEANRAVAQRAAAATGVGSA